MDRVSVIHTWLVSRRRTNLHALVGRQQLQAKPVRCEPLPTLLRNDLADRALRTKVLLAVHNVHPEPRQRAPQRLGRERLPLLFLARAHRRAGFPMPLAMQRPREHDLGRERDQLLHEVVRREVSPQRLVGPSGSVRALDEHGREGVRDLGRRRAPDGPVPRFGGNAVRLDVPKKEKFALGGDVLEEEARALVHPRRILAMAKRHAAHGHVGKDGLVFPIGVEAASTRQGWPRS